MADMNQLLIAGSNAGISSSIPGVTSDGNVAPSVGPHERVNTRANRMNHIVPVTGDVQDTGNAEMHLSNNAHPDQSIAMSLNLALAGEDLSKVSTQTSHNNANTGNAVNTANNSNNTTTIPTPLNVSQSSNDGSNPGTTKSTGLSGLRTSIHSMASNASSPVVSSGLSSNTVRMFQRMDEMSARLIAMEEMFHKLCKTIDQQTNTITDLKLENSEFAKGLSSKIDNIAQAHEQLKDKTDQDSFVTDLLNSITNVSSTYLRKIRSRTDVNKKGRSTDSLNELDQHFLPQYHNGSQQQNQHSLSNNVSSANLQAFGDKNSSNPVFTLNPEGIKRRKKNDFPAQNNSLHHNQSHNQDRASHPGGNASINNNNHTVPNTTNDGTNHIPNSGYHSNIPSGSQSYTDLNSLNPFGTISLPNLTLEPTGITPLLKYGANGMNFSRLNEGANGTGESNNILEQQAHTQGINDDRNKSQISRISKNPKHPNFTVGIEAPNSAGIEMSVNPDPNPDPNTNHRGAEDDEEEDDDGYQEDDDDDNEDEDEDEDDEDEDDLDDDDENEEDEADDKDELGMQRHANKQPKKRKRKAVAGDDAHMHQENSTGGSDAKGSAKKTTENGSDRRSTDPHKDSNDKRSGQLANKHRDINYTLLKAPSNVRTIWEEYSHGIDGSPSIKQLEEKYGNKWRLNRNRKTFARRKRLYKFILNGVHKGKSPEEMINILEERRLYKDENGEVKRRTIGWLQQSLTGI